MADGKAVGEDNVGNGDEGVGKGQVLLGPWGPVNGRQSTGGVVGLDTSSNHGDSNGKDNGDEVDVAENGKLGEGRREGQEEEDDGRDDTKDEGADGVVGNVEEGNGAGQAVRTHEQNQLQGKHGSNKLVSKATSNQSTGISVVGNLGKLDLDHANKVTCVDGEETKTNGAENTGNHAESGKSTGQRERSEGNGLDDEDNGQTPPSQTMEFLLALLGLGALNVLAELIACLAGDGSIVEHVGGGVLLVIVAMVLFRPRRGDGCVRHDGMCVWVSSMKD